MILDCSRYVGPCVCGRSHQLETKIVVVEHGALRRFEDYMEEVGLAGLRRTVIYDSNIYALAGERRVKADQEIVLPAQGLRSEDKLIENMMEELDDPGVLVAFGAGTIMDFARYPAYKLGLPFVAIPTLASADGFTASICSAIIDGHKKSTRMKAPQLVVADLDIIQGAPLRMVTSGINDILAKYISLTDWKISALVAGEDYCPMIGALTQEALDTMRRAADRLAATGEADHEAMTLAQMLSGLTMQLWDSSRAASGAEHLIAHLVEMKPPRFEHADGTHGECVGVGTFACCREYHRLARLRPRARAFEPLTRDWIEEKFGAALCDGIVLENENDVLKGVDAQRAVDRWDEVCALIRAIPEPDELEALYRACGCRYLPEHVGIDPALGGEMLEISSAIRNRLTLIRLKRLLDFDA